MISDSSKNAFKMALENPKKNIAKKYKIHEIVLWSQDTPWSQNNRKLGLQFLYVFSDINQLFEGESYIVLFHLSQFDCFPFCQGHQKPVNDIREMSGIPHSCLGYVSQFVNCKAYVEQSNVLTEES